MLTTRTGMQQTVIEARDLPEAWHFAMIAVLQNGYEYVIERGSFEGQKRKELDLAVIRIQHPYILPLVPTTPPGVPAPTTMEYVQEYLPYLMSSHKEPDEEYTYGEDIEPQLEPVIEMLRRSPETNQAFIAVGNRGSIKQKDPPCLRGIQCRVRYGALHLIVYFRSWDLWGGFPSNLAAIQLLKEYMAKEIGVRDGELLCLSGGLHLYEHTWPYAEQVLRRGGA